MFPALNNHPFAVDAFFERSVVLAIAVPKDQLQPLIPPCLTLDTFKDDWGFIAIAIVQTTALRPAGFPAFMGHNFFLIGYRIFVRHTSNAGKKMRGLYMLKSETDKKKMQLLGNIFTQYSYTTTDIRQSVSGNSIHISSSGSGLSISVETGDKQTPLPEKSPFTDWKEARKFAGPMPFTFSYNAATKEVLTIEGIRENWVPKPLQVLACKSSFIDGMNLQGAVLANAFIIEQIPYHWKKGTIEVWNG